MNRNLYMAAIISYGIALVFMFFWIFNNLVGGLAFNEFTTHPDLVVVDWVIMILCELLLLKYFHAKKYKVAFVTSLISMITFMVLYTSVFSFYKGIGSGELINLFVSVHLVAAITFSVGLVLSKASKQKILKLAGALGIVLGSIVLLTHIYGLNLAKGETLNLILAIQLWTSRFGDALILIFLILNFYQEIKHEQRMILSS
ncbi:hypothetical protein [Ekhidna sp.]|uniref:hypothetical protein n=1 Tax=Ekhidna sp. TaxID=2608089 RepID=UPI003BAB5815